MINIGIDAGKNKHCCAVYDDRTGEVLIRPFFFTNDQKGFENLYGKIKQYIHRKHCAGMEPTGHYMNNLITYLLDKKVTVKLVRAQAVHNRRKERGGTAKNDKLDALLIAELLSDPKVCMPVTKRSQDMKELREITRIYHQMQEQQNQDMNRFQRCIDIIFPEYNKLPWTAYSQAYMAVLKAYPSASKIASQDIRNLRKALEIKGRGRRTKVTAEVLKEAAKASVADDNNIAVECEIQSIIAIIETREKQLKLLTKKIEEFSSQLNSPIVSIPGIGAITGMTILSEIGDITYFTSEEKLTAFAGMAPRVYESSQYEAQHLPISKKGSRYLRKALYQAIFTVCNNSPVFHSYYTLKRNQGKSHRCAQGHCVRKLLRVIYKLLKTNTQFNPDLCK
jgi:transposase